MMLYLDKNGAYNQTDPVTSVTITKQNDSYLVSSLDSKLRLMDKSDGGLLKEFYNSEVWADLPIYRPST